MRKQILLAVLIVISVIAAGCSNGAKPITTTVQQPAPVENPSPEYSEKSVPLENVDVDDLRTLEITPSGDPNCFLSPCDCNCYMVKNVPLDKKKPMCAVNCRQQYGISGCVFRGNSCSAIQA